jgi:ParB/RepB/Spo0J family partition protein
MQHAQNTAISNEYRSVPIGILVESATNPRKRFDEKNLEELAASMRAQGILAPLLVRELEESKYEVVAGARRFRAAKLAELENLPVRVIKLTDAEAIEAQCVENLQREDIHPLEEALGFKSLLELGEPAYTIATIASRAGKSEAYIYGRIRLADLIPPVAEAFLKDQITIGHALLIAKLPASQQQEAFSAAFRGLWTSEGNSQVLIPVRELAAWIESNILLQLASAPFDKHDDAHQKEAQSWFQWLPSDAKSRPELCCATTGGSLPLSLPPYCKAFIAFLGFWRSASLRSAIFLLNWSPAQRCQRSTTQPVEAFFWEPTTGAIVLMSEGPLPARPEPICRSNTPGTPVWSGFRPDRFLVYFVLRETFWN